jgi:hypothetical protein
MTPLLFKDSKHWRDQADEARANAEKTAGVFKKSLLTVAGHYDRLAKLAEDRNMAELDKEIGEAVR